MFGGWEQAVVELLLDLGDHLDVGGLELGYAVAVGVAQCVADVRPVLLARLVGDYEYWDLWLTVDRAGATVYDEPIGMLTAACTAASSTRSTRRGRS
jgi:hypothetical protein